MTKFTFLSSYKMEAKHSKINGLENGKMNLLLLVVCQCHNLRIVTDWQRCINLMKAIITKEIIL